MIIVLSAWPGAGKTAFADALVKHRGAATVYLGEPLKQLLLETDASVRSLVSRLGWEQAKRLTPVRRALQDLGWHLTRMFGGDLLAEKAAFEVDRLLRANVPVIIPDARSPEELTFWDQPAWSIRLIRPGLAAPNHPRDRELDDTRHDRWLTNHSTLDDLTLAALETFDDFARAQVSLL